MCARVKCAAWRACVGGCPFRVPPVQLLLLPLTHPTEVKASTLSAASITLSVSTAQWAQEFRWPLSLWRPPQPCKQDAEERRWECVAGGGGGGGTGDTLAASPQPAVAAQGVYTGPPTVRAKHAGVAPQGVQVGAPEGGQRVVVHLVQHRVPAVTGAVGVAHGGVGVGGHTVRHRRAHAAQVWGLCYLLPPSVAGV